MKTKPSPSSQLFEPYSRAFRREMCKLEPAPFLQVAVVTSVPSHRHELQMLLVFSFGALSSGYKASAVFAGNGFDLGTGEAKPTAARQYHL